MLCLEGYITTKGGGGGGGRVGISDGGRRVNTGGGSGERHVNGSPVIVVEYNVVGYAGCCCDVLCSDAPASVEEAAAGGSVEEAGVGEVETTDVSAESVI